MLQFNWTHTQITTNAQANWVMSFVQYQKPTIGAFDTETTGLHIIADKPFFYVFGFLDFAKKKGYTFSVDLEKQPELAKQVIRAWHHYATTLDLYLGHNIKYDLHMMLNIDLPYTGKNVSDTMYYIRYAHDAIPERFGGPPLRLKAYATQYISRNANSYEKVLKNHQSAMAKGLNMKLRQRLIGCGTPPPQYKAASYTLSVISEIFKDPIMTIEDLPTKIRQPYIDWLNLDVPITMKNNISQGLVEAETIPYNLIDRDILATYAHFDVVWTLEIYALLQPIVQARKTQNAIDIENKLIYPVLEMERVGFNPDEPYLEECRKNIHDYIIERRAALAQLIGQHIKVGQHELIKNIFHTEFGLDVESTENDYLKLLLSDLIRAQNNPEAVQFIEILQELRTLEKWYSVYIMRFKRELIKYPGRLFTTINSVGTVSGRVTSDFQQFPKKPVLTADKKELFYPRRLIKVDTGNLNKIIYLDYSQIELRFQAMYTILVSSPDLNLCRAYMPYECINEEGEKFGYTNPIQLQNYTTHSWRLCESPDTCWNPTDVHGATTTLATGLNRGDPGFDNARSDIGKRVNFAKNYGAQYNRIRQMFPTKSDDEIRRINDAYYLAFPGVKAYHNYCYTRAQNFPWTQNLFGIKYYGLSGHKLINTLIQGSAAFFLKLKIIELYDFIKNNRLESRWQMQIHDELSFLTNDTELPQFKTVKEIMENFPDTLVPIIADVDLTSTCWAEKEKYNFV